MLITGKGYQAEVCESKGGKKPWEFTINFGTGRKSARKCKSIVWRIEGGADTSAAAVDHIEQIVQSFLGIQLILRDTHETQSQKEAHVESPQGNVPQAARLRRGTS